MKQDEIAIILCYIVNIRETLYDRNLQYVYIEFNNLFVKCSNYFQMRLLCHKYFYLYCM